MIVKAVLRGYFFFDRICLFPDGDPSVFGCLCAKYFSLYGVLAGNERLGAEIDRLAFFPPDADVLREKVVLKAAQTSYSDRNL